MPDADLLVIGGGPAGCGAAVMAASVGLSTTIIDRAERLGGALWGIAAIDNVLGGHRTGSVLARAVLADVERAGVGVIRAAVASVVPADHDVAVLLADGRRLTGSHAVVATGAGPIQPTAAPWISVAEPLELPPLWEANPDGADGRTWLVLGADRPLGTFLRANPALPVRLLVPYPPTDAYKTDEVAAEPRVTLVPVDYLTLGADLTGQPGDLRGDRVFVNIGVAPTALGGLARDDTGYCPPALQHPRIHVAGDLRSPRGQRVQTAMGTGAEAALTAYYSMRADHE